MLSETVYKTDDLVNAIVCIRRSVTRNPAMSLDLACSLLRACEYLEMSVNAMDGNISEFTFKYKLGGQYAGSE